MGKEVEKAQQMASEGSKRQTWQLTYYLHKQLPVSHASGSPHPAADSVAWSSPPLYLSHPPQCSVSVNHALLARRMRQNQFKFDLTHRSLENFLQIYDSSSRDSEDEYPPE